MRFPTRLALACLVGASVVSGVGACTAGAGVETTPFGGGAPDEALPSGFGSLRTEAISVSLVAEDLQIRITPLAPDLLRLTAPDAEARLSATLERAGGPRPETAPILVSVYTESPAATFEPRDLRMELRGRRLPILEVVPISPEWGTGQLRQRFAVSAVYRFEGVVRWLEEGPRFEYRGGSNDGWRGLLPTLDVERARVRARARGGG